MTRCLEQAAAAVAAVLLSLGTFALSASLPQVGTVAVVTVPAVA
jgi:hypothetical protein